MSDRGHILNLIDSAMESGARLSSACAQLKISTRTIERWRKHPGSDDRRKSAARKRTAGNKLSKTERTQILSICNCGEFADMAPNQIVPALADQGVYVASEASFYRVLRQEKQLAHRAKARPATHKRPSTIKATQPNQLWSWDITYLPSTIKGVYFYLYMVMDIYSRKIVGWEVYDTQCASHACSLIRKTCLKEQTIGTPLVLHSDNGSPMKGATMLVTLQKLGVVPSFSRPSVSNDNAYSEALFKTLKYHPGYPQVPFEGLDQARRWVLGFEHWYNEKHCHSGIKFVTPAQRHRREDIAILAKRNRVYAKARKNNPQRWTGATRNWEPVEQVCLNPNKSSRKLNKAA